MSPNESRSLSGSPPHPHLQIRIVAGGAGRITSRVPPGSNCITGEMIISDFLIMFFSVTVKDDSSPTKNHWFSLDRPLEWLEISNRNSCRLVLHSLSFTLSAGFQARLYVKFPLWPKQEVFWLCKQSSCCCDINSFTTSGTICYSLQKKDILRLY